MSTLFSLVGFCVQLVVIFSSIALIIDTHEYLCSQDTADESDATLPMTTSHCAKSMTTPAIVTTISEFEPYPDINSMTVKQLKSYAKASGFTGYSALRKAELVALLSEF
jgi:hypothetical protein